MRWLQHWYVRLPLETLLGFVTATSLPALAIYQTYASMYGTYGHTVDMQAHFLGVPIYAIKEVGEPYVIQPNMARVWLVILGAIIALCEVFAWGLRRHRMRVA